MTSEYDNKLWQDVYHVPIGKEIAYVKLQNGSCGNKFL